MKKKTAKYCHQIEINADNLSFTPILNAVYTIDFICAYFKENLCVDSAFFKSIFLLIIRKFYPIYIFYMNSLKFLKINGNNEFVMIHLTNKCTKNKKKFII